MTHISFVTSKLQKCLSLLKGSLILDENLATEDLEKLDPTIKYACPGVTADIRIFILYDALNGGGREIYGHYGVICRMFAHSDVN